MKHSINSKIPINLNIKFSKRIAGLIIIGVIVIFTAWKLFGYNYKPITADAKKDIAKDKYINAGVGDIKCSGRSHNNTYTYIKCSLKTEALRTAYKQKYVYYGQKKLATGGYHYNIGLNLKSVKEKLES